MRFLPFVFVDGWKLYSSNGNSLYISKDDLQNYEENGLSDDEIKSISYSYLTSQNLFSFESISGVENEF